MSRLADIPWPAESAHVLPANATSAQVARRLVREELSGCPRSVVDVAELLVSELVANAIRHGGSAPLIRIEVEANHIQIAVQDGSTTAPELKEPSLDSGGGRGLLLVDALSLAWGWSFTPTGKRVWFTL